MYKDTQNLLIRTRDDLYELKQHGNQDYPFALYYVDSRDLQLELVHWHWHEELEYIVVLVGKARFYAGENSVVLESGQGLFINKNVLHRVKPFEDHHCIYYSVVFHTSYVFGYRASSLTENYLNPVLNHPTFRYHVLTQQNTHMVPFFDKLKEIIDVNEAQEFGYELMTKSLLCQAWLLLLKGLQNIPAEDSGSGNVQALQDEERIKSALTFIATHYSESLTLQDIADSIHISKSECCRSFKRCLKISPFEYLIKYRVYSAAIMIIHSGHTISISEVAETTGFNSSSYFNKMFKKYTGLTPSAFRKQTQKNSSSLSDLLEGNTQFQDNALLDVLLKQK